MARAESCAHVAHGMSDLSHMSNLDIYRSPMVPLWGPLCSIHLVWNYIWYPFCYYLSFCDYTAIVLPRTSKDTSLQGFPDPRNTLSTISCTAAYDSTMAAPNQERAASVVGGEGGEPPVVQTLNVVPQKVIQVDKPSKYYGVAAFTSLKV